MHFFEFLAVVCAVVVLPSVVFYNIRKMVEAKYAGKKKLSKGKSDGMRMSELQALIEIAVEDATAPLLARIEDLELQKPTALLDAPQSEMVRESDFDLIEPERKHVAVR